MDDKPFARPCILCRRVFKPKDRIRHWYCDSCRKKVYNTPGLRECKNPTEWNLPHDYSGGSYIDRNE